MKTTTTETIARVRELDAKATAGPWRAQKTERGDTHPRPAILLCFDGPQKKDGQDEYIHADFATVENAECAAEYRTLCPQLADRCEALELALDVAKRALQEIYGCATFAGAHAETCADTAISEINKLTNQ